MSDVTWLFGLTVHARRRSQCQQNLLESGTGVARGQATEWWPTHGRRDDVGNLAGVLFSSASIDRRLCVPLISTSDSPQASRPVPACLPVVMKYGRCCRLASLARLHCAHAASGRRVARPHATRKTEITAALRTCTRLQITVITKHVVT